MEAPLRPLVIIGAGGHGREVLDVVEAMNERAPAYEFLGFLDDAGGDDELLRRRGVSVIGPVSALESMAADYLIAIGAPEARRRIDAYASGLGREAALAVHPSATCGSDVQMGPGAVVTAGVRMTTNIRLGRHVHLNVNATVSHDCRLGDYVMLNPGARVSGNVTLHDGVTVGAGATVIQGRTIGPGATVGAGACVVSDLAGSVTAIGVPARPVMP